MKKELLIEKVPNSALFYVKYEGGGELPKALQGHYTSKQIAQKSIDSYLENREQKTNGKTDSSKRV